MWQLSSITRLVGIVIQPSRGFDKAGWPDRISPSNSMLFSMFIQKFIFVNYLATGSITLFINIVVLLGCCFGFIFVYLFDYFWRKYQSIFITDFHCAKQNKLNSAWYPSSLICIKFRLHELRLFKKTFFLYKFSWTSFASLVPHGVYLFFIHLVFNHLYRWIFSNNNTDPSFNKDSKWCLIDNFLICISFDCR